MLKFTYLVQLGLLGAVALPAALQERGSLDQALEATERALSELVGAKGSELRGAYDEIELAIATTEAPLDTPRARDELLERLRHEVGRLHEELDELELEAARGPAGPGPPKGAAGTGAGSGQLPARPGAVGLDDQQRTLLGAPRPLAPPPGAPAGPGSEPRLALEQPGYTADALRHGRALLLAGRHAEALALLERAQDQPEARYWRARCLERLGRLDEALLLYEALAEEEPETELAWRAAGDRDFVAWLRAFEARLDERRKP